MKNVAFILAVVGCLVVVDISRGDWSIHSPTQNDAYSLTSNIEGTGTGTADHAIRVRVKRNGLTLGEKLDTVGPDENWLTNIIAPEAGWHQTGQQENCSYQLSAWNSQTEAYVPQKDKVILIGDGGQA